MRVKLVKKQTKKGGKTYVSYSINLPRSLVEGIGWADREELELEVKAKDGEIILVLK